MRAGFGASGISAGFGEAATWPEDAIYGLPASLAIATTLARCATWQIRQTPSRLGSCL